MKRMSILWSLLLVTSALPAGAGASTSSATGLVSTADSSAPVMTVREEPRVVIVPGSTVYAVDDTRVDFDCFKYGVFWYAHSSDRWYRARSHRGPFVQIETRYLPRAIVTVPASQWKHHPQGGPPGRMRNYASR